MAPQDLAIELPSSGQPEGPISLQPLELHSALQPLTTRKHFGLASQWLMDHQISYQKQKRPSQHQRRRDALANAKERLAELQRLPDAEGSPVEKLPRALRLPEKRLPLISLWDTAIAAIEARHGANALGLCILWPAQLALTGYLVYLIIQNRDWLTRHVGTSFAPTLALSLLNVTRTLVYNLYAIHQQEVDAASMLASGGHDLKDCDLQGGQVQANANCISGLVCCDAKCAAALGISSLQGKCVPGCEENVIGMIFYRYMITTGLLLSLSDIASSAFWKYIGQPYDFDAPQTKYFLAIFLLSPPRVRFSAQRTSTLAYFLLLGALVLCSIPLVFNMTWQRDRCGPNQGTSMRAALAAGIAASPRVVSQILRWVVDPMVLVSVAILLAFCLAVVLIQKHGKSKGLLAMRREFYRYRRDMQSKVVWMRRGGALGGIPNNMSFSTPHKSSLIPVARLDSGSQRMRHRTHSQTGQPPQNTLDRILSEDAEETEDGWEGPSHAHRTDMESAISVTARADSSAPLLRGSRNI
ncbi:hypothetical protein WJX84_002325 [Apatococcus fuscideae]|uniref:Uncharacterized protein n=1 Tax=Apatococcus fuscideae TaxID=2026836 RepID=A0AAW1T784_9CHLO